MLKFTMLLFIIVPYALFSQNLPGDPACIPTIIIQESENDICAGTLVIFSAGVANSGSNGVYKWKKNNLTTGTISNASYTPDDIHDGDTVICEYSCKTACGVDTTAVSNSIILHVLNDITPLITVSNNDPLICEGELTVFTTTAYYGNAVPSYQWLVNNIPVGTDDPVYTTSTITNGAKVECVLTISAPSCPGSSRSARSQMNIYVYPMIHPAIDITASKKNICRGEEVILTALANGGAYPAFAWQINGVSTGDDTAILRRSNLKDGDMITCTVTIDQDSRCHTSTSAGSNTIVMQVHDFTDPTINIASPLLDVCEGKPISFNAAIKNAGENVFYQWLINGRSAGSNSPTFIYDRFANNDTVSCMLSTNIPGCTITASVSSDSEAVTIRSAPVITFSSPEISIMSGEAATLHPDILGNITSALWIPRNLVLTPQSPVTSTILLYKDTIFNLAVSDGNGCKANQSLTVRVLQKLYMPSSFTPNNDGKNDVFHIQPDASVSLEEFSVFDRWGKAVFKTRNITTGWDGTFKGNPMGIGAYIYFIKGIIQDKKKIMKGTVILQR
jgi:gliding motility-associated-like protein